MNHVQFPPSHLFKFFQEGKAVKALAAVHQKCGEGNRDERCAAGKKCNQDELECTRVDCQTHQQRIILFKT